MNEPIPDALLPAGHLPLGDRPDERVDVLQALEPFLHPCRIAGKHLRDHRRVKLLPLYARDGEQPTINRREVSELPLDHAPHRFWEPPLDVRNRCGQSPPALNLHDGAVIAEVAEEIHQEEWAALCPGMHEREEGGRERVDGKLERQVLRDLVRRQELEADLAAYAPRLQVELHRPEDTSA